ncbi:MAG: enoyl-CoA hydratase-related protein [Steroidobacteraceae bacterium]
MSNPVLKEIDGAVAYITINRPEARNAFNEEACALFEEHLRSVENDSAVRCVVIRGAGAHFMAGGDLGEFANMLAKPGLDVGQVIERRVIRDGNQFPVILERMPKPVITSIRGGAAGGGAGLALAGDFILASETAFFVFAHVVIGLSPDNATLWYLTRLVGPLKAKKLLMLGSRVGAKEAHQLGMLTELYPDAELDKATADLAQRLAKGPRTAYGSIKALVNEAQRRSLGEELVLEARATGASAGSADFREGVAAFLEKRPANFA